MVNSPIFKGVFLDKAAAGPVYDLGFSNLENSLPDFSSFDRTAPEDIVSRIGKAQVIVVNKLMIDADIMAQSPDLRLIAVLATGVNNVDLNAAKEHGVMVCNARRYGTASVVQHVFALMFALAGRLLDYDRDVRAGLWQKSPDFCLLDYPVVELAGKTLGIIGYGELGQAMAGAAQALGMNIFVAEHKEAESVRSGRVAFEQVLRESDVLTLHCPLTADTKNLIGERELSLMKPSAFLINTARGGIVNELALCQALMQKKIAGAGVDVLTTEPPQDGNPLLNPDIPNLIVTPHMAWGSREARQRLLDDVAENIRAFVGGNPRNVVV